MNVRLHGGLWVRTVCRNGWWTCDILPGRRYRSMLDMRFGFVGAGWIVRGVW